MTLQNTQEEDAPEVKAFVLSGSFFQKWFLLPRQSGMLSCCPSLPRLSFTLSDSASVPSPPGDLPRPPGGTCMAVESWRCSTPSVAGNPACSHHRGSASGSPDTHSWVGLSALHLRGTYPRGPSYAVTSPPSGGSATKVPSILWFYHCQHMSTKASIHVCALQVERGRTWRITWGSHSGIRPGSAHMSSAHCHDLDAVSWELCEEKKKQVGLVTGWLVSDTGRNTAVTRLVKVVLTSKDWEALHILQLTELHVTEKAVFGMHHELHRGFSVLTIKGRTRVRKNKRKEREILP